MRNRTLRLKKETLTELSTTDLGRVVGGSALTCIETQVCNNSDFKECFTGIPCLTDSCITGTTHLTE